MHRILNLTRSFFIYFLPHWHILCHFYFVDNASSFMTHVFPPSLIKKLITVCNGRMEDHERVVRDTCHNHHSCYINTNYSIYLVHFISYKCNSYFCCWILNFFQYLTIFLFICQWSWCRYRSLTNFASLFLLAVD